MWWFNLIWGGTGLVLLLWYILAPNSMVQPDEEHPD
jgi:hypothetical protein